VLGLLVSVMKDKNRLEDEMNTSVILANPRKKRNTLIRML